MVIHQGADFCVINVNREKHLYSANKKVLHGKMSEDDPCSLQMDYAKLMLLPLLMGDLLCQLRRVLIIGLGTGALPKFFIKNWPNLHLDIVEISNEVIQLAHREFHCPVDSENFKIHHQCASQYVKETKSTYDLIMVDAVSDEGQLGPLQSIEFLQNCASLIKPGGLMVSNALILENNLNIYINDLDIVFKNNRISFLNKMEGNIISILSNNKIIIKDEAEVSEKSEEIRKKSNLDIAEHLFSLSRVGKILSL